MIEIKHRYTGEVIYRHDGDTLIWADLHEADLHEADLHEANLRVANLREADLRVANLHEANLHEADLHGADLRGADLDFAVWPLWCGSFGVRVDRNIASQHALHFCHLDCDDPDYLTARAALLKFANSAPVRARHNLDAIR